MADAHETALFFEAGFKAAAAAAAFGAADDVDAVRTVADEAVAVARSGALSVGAGGIAAAVGFRQD